MSGNRFLADDELPDHILRWLDAFQRRVVRELGLAFGNDRPVARGRQGRLLDMIPSGGIRLGDLAERAAVTKQALGQMVASLEQQGLVTVGADPADGRARLVRRTARGDQAVHRIHEAIAVAEAALRDELGARRYDAMKASMRDLAD